MSEYDFKPDFQGEWKRSKINRKALAWLTLGVSPSAGERLIEVGNKSERTEEERRFIQGFDNFSLIENKENKGFAAGNNQGMAAAGGDYILLMNNDVVVTPGWLDRMILCAEKSPDIGMVGPVSNYVSGPQLVDDVKYNTSSLAGLNEFAVKCAEKYSGRSRRILRFRRGRRSFR